MKNPCTKIITLLLLLFTSLAFGQSNYYDVTTGNGYGLRFNSSDSYKIHYGSAAEYQFGPVSTYAMKFNMTNDTGKGWVWGVAGSTPIAALDNTGQFQILGGAYFGPHRYTSGGFVGKLYLSGSHTEFSMSNRNVANLVVNPTNGERFAFYTDGPSNDGELNLWSNIDIMTFRKDGKIGINNGSPSARLDVVGTGSSTVDVKVNGRLSTGDASNNGGVFVNSGQTMMFGQNGASQLGLYYSGWKLVMGSDGNVGIGNTTPTSRLHITGAGGTTSDIKVNGRIATGDAGNQGGLWVNSGQTMMFGQSASDKLGIYNNGAWHLVATSAGNIGIGTQSPNEKLTVNGKVYAREVKVDLSVPGPDYVFDKDYKLPTLEEVKSYIDKHHHLPEVPSAKEMEANGINLSEMNMILLKKVEELTLQMILLKKEVDELKSNK